MAYWSLKTLSNFYDNSFDVILFYDSNVENFELEKVHINNFNMVKDFNFVKFIKLNYYEKYKQKKDPFSYKDQNFFSNISNIWMFKWFGLEKIFSLGYEKILFLDVDTVFYRNPAEIFSSLNEKCVYVSLEQMFSSIISSNSKYISKISPNKPANPLLLNRNINNGNGINGGQIFFSKVKMNNFFDLYYKSRLDLNEDAKQLFQEGKIDEIFYKYLTSFNEQWAPLLVFDFYKINVTKIPPILIKRGKIIDKTPCVFHYEQIKYKHELIPEELHTPLIKEQRLKFMKEKTANK